MSYADPIRVSAILGVDVSEVVEPILSIADNYVETLLNRKFGVEYESVQKYDIDHKNPFFVSNQTHYIFALDNSPVISVDSVQLGSSILSADQYSIDLNSSIVKIKDAELIPTGVDAVQITYTYGYATVPEVIIDYASYFAANIQDGTTSVVRSESGAILTEVEIGRYREKYASLQSYLSGKYSSILSQMESSILEKYKLWE